jgi:hypothetical protein
MGKGRGECLVSMWWMRERNKNGWGFLGMMDNTVDEGGKNASDDRVEDFRNVCYDK